MTDTSVPTQVAKPVQAVATSGPAPTGGGAMLTPTAKNSPGLFTFMPVTSEKRSRYIKIMIYGQAGSGKTTLAGSACNIDPASDVLVVSAEKGDLVFTDNDRIRRPELIDMMKVDRIEQLQKAYEWAKYHCIARDRNDEAGLRTLQNQAFLGTPQVADAEMPEEFKRLRRFKTIVIDSMTDIEALNMNAILGVSDKGFDVGDDLAPAGYTEFRKNNNTIQQIVRAFRDLPVHLILICGQKWQQDEQKQLHYGPWMTGQLATQLQSFVDVVGYMTPSSKTVGGEMKSIRKLYVQPVPQVKFDAKCRIASLKETFFEDPEFEYILRACKFL